MHRRLKIFCLLFFFALCGAAMVATYSARQHRPPPTRELFSVVNRQLSALRVSDFGGAYRHAAAGLQEQFSLAQFELMIRRDFASMTRAEHVEFGAVQVRGAAALVQVFLTAPDGTVHGFLYSFTAEADGWKIDGVQPLGVERPRNLPGLHV